ncbi:hypothetical protein ARMSODRAFT_980457 [Armillaria solidipes]|uniref:Uncharacterized protein n=1 Tax=Armillaria solidipes TaxID=1076256 RepID=A0A2H3B9T3_9AGAR|nr:hypothetical protein ARMSODRAFT_980457 [Armillaria solidipes]
MVSSTFQLLQGISVSARISSSSLSMSGHGYIPRGKQTNTSLSSGGNGGGDPQEPSGTGSRGQTHSSGGSVTNSKWMHCLASSCGGWTLDSGALSDDEQARPWHSSGPHRKKDATIKAVLAEETLWLGVEPSFRAKGEFEFQFDSSCDSNIGRSINTGRAEFPGGMKECGFVCEGGLDM